MPVSEGLLFDNWVFSLRRYIVPGRKRVIFVADEW